MYKISIYGVNISMGIFENNTFSLLTIYTCCSKGFNEAVEVKKISRNSRYF